MASVRECPVKLLDASDGRASFYGLPPHPPGSFQRANSSLMLQLRASYPIVDHRERQVAPHSVAFNVGANRCVDPGSEPRFCTLMYVTPCLCGVRLYCGFEDAIEVFDIHRPGEGTRLRTTPSKKSRDGLKGKFSRTSPRHESADALTWMLIGRDRIGFGIRARCVLGRLCGGLVQPLVAIFVQHSDLL